MIGFFITWLTNIIALIVVVGIIPGIEIHGWQTAVVAALILGLLNAFLRPLVLLVTLPLQLISLGFFTLLVNGFMFYLVSKIVEDFHVASFWSAFWGALVFSIVSFILNLFISPEGRINVTFYKEYPSKTYRGKSVIDVEGKPADRDEGDDDRRIKQA